MNELNYTCNLSAGLRMTPLKAALVQGEANAHTLRIAFEKDGAPRITWSPDLRTAQPPRVYTVYGKPTLDAADWAPVTDENRGKMRFFKVTVEIEGFND